MRRRTDKASVAPARDNELQGAATAARAHRLGASRVRRCASARWRRWCAEMMRLDADAAAVSRSTTSSDSSAADPALEDRRCPTHEDRGAERRRRAPRRAGDAAPSAFADGRRGGGGGGGSGWRSARRTARRLAATRGVGVRRPLFTRCRRRRPSARSASAGRGSRCGVAHRRAAGRAKTRRVAGRRRRARRRARSSRRAALPRAHPPVPLSSAMAHAIGQRQAMQQLAAAQHKGAVPRVDSHSPSPAHEARAPSSRR